MTKKTKSLLISRSYLVKFLILAFLIFFLCAFSAKDGSQIVLINTDNKKTDSAPWQERRELAEIIQNISFDGPGAIVVTLPYLGYTSQGADLLLIKAVKEAGCVYFSYPAWGVLHSYARGIGHINFIEEKGTVFIKKNIAYENKNYPALSAFLSKEIFHKSLAKYFSFHLANAPKFRQYSFKDVFRLKGKGEFKGNICFVGDEKTNILQAAALYNIISEGVPITNNRKLLYYFAIAFLSAACIGLIYAARIRIRKKQIIKLPYKFGKLSFGRSFYLSKAKLTGIFDLRAWPDGRIWLWMGDYGPVRNVSRDLGLKKFFYGFKEAIGSREAMIRLNDELYENKNYSFINLIFMEINPKAGIINFCNAAFERPLLFINATKEFREFDNATEPLGIRKNTDIDEEVLTLDKSDILLLFNSGIVKSQDKEGRFIDLEQLKYIITQNSQLSAQALAEKILRVTLDFNSARPSEDMFFLAIKAS